MARFIGCLFLLLGTYMLKAKTTPRQHIRRTSHRRSRTQSYPKARYYSGREYKGTTTSRRGYTSQRLADAHHIMTLMPYLCRFAISVLTLPGLPFPSCTLDASHRSKYHSHLDAGMLVSNEICELHCSCLSLAIRAGTPSASCKSAPLTSRCHTLISHRAMGFHHLLFFAMGPPPAQSRESRGGGLFDRPEGCGAPPVCCPAQTSSS